MTIEQAMELIHGVEWRGSRPGLARVRELLHRLGDPQDGLQFVHIAGTNGKGSTAAMLASILRAAGYTTGLFTSPYLERFAERMQVNGVPVPDAEFAAVCEALQPCIAAMDDPPTEFELVTAAAMLWFRRRGCDVVVLEVGLGGRLDATNVIAAPACAVITNIGLDHTEILGDTLEQIAREKAGILKPGTRAVSYPQTPEVRAVLHEICAQRGIPDAAVRAGLAQVRWPARFELLRRAPWFVLDGGHNPQCAQTVADNLARYFPGRRITLLVGVLADKDYPAMLAALDTQAAAYIAATPLSPRALPAAELGDYLKRFGKPVTVCADPAQAAELALAHAAPEDVICAVGSLYMAGAIRMDLRRDHNENSGH